MSTKSTKVVDVVLPDGPIEGTDPEPEVFPTPAVDPKSEVRPSVPVAKKPRPQPVRPEATVRTPRLSFVPPPTAPLPSAPLDPLPDSVGPRQLEEPLPTVTASDGRKVAFLLSQYKSTNPLTLYSLMASWDRKESGLMLNYGDAMLVHSRNRLAHRFLHETQFEWALFVDDDMILPCGNAVWFKKATGWKDYPDSLAGVKALDRLLSHKKTVVGALYFGRNHRGEGKPMFAEGMRSVEVANDARNVRANRTLRPTAWVGTGCLLVHRSVLSEIEKRFTHLAPTTPDEPFKFFSPAPDILLSRVAQAKAFIESGDTASALASLEVALSPAGMNNAWSGEDVVFTTRARMVGHQPHVDFGCVCGHVGSCVWGPTNTEPPKA